MKGIKVLFVDDDVALGNIVTLALEDAGCEVHYQTSLLGIAAAVKEMQPHIIVLDLEIGTKNGIDAVPELKRTAPDIPILFVSSHLESENLVKALEAGAVSYLKKPFEMVELLAYIQRFSKSFSSQWMELGLFRLNMNEHLLMSGEASVRKLSTMEYRLLKKMMQDMNKVISRKELIHNLWGEEETETCEQSLNNYITKIRKYLAEDQRIEIVAIPKVGYKLQLK